MSETPLGIYADVDGDLEEQEAIAAAREAGHGYRRVLARHLRPHATFGDDPSGFCGCADCDPRGDCGCRSCRGLRRDGATASQCEDDAVTGAEPGCTCGGMAACLQCQERDAAGRVQGEAGEGAS